MAEIEFSDGVKFDTSGDYRVERRFDGYYVVGNGMLCPVDDADEGKELIATLAKKEDK